MDILKLSLLLLIVTIVVVLLTKTQKETKQEVIKQSTLADEFTKAENSRGMTLWNSYDLTSKLENHFSLLLHKNNLSMIEISIDIPVGDSYSWTFISFKYKTFVIDDVKINREYLEKDFDIVKFLNRGFTSTKTELIKLLEDCPYTEFSLKKIRANKIYTDFTKNTSLEVGTRENTIIHNVATNYYTVLLETDENYVEISPKGIITVLDQIMPTEEDKEVFYKEVCPKEDLNNWAITNVGCLIKNKEQFIRIQMVMYKLKDTKNSMAYSLVCKLNKILIHLQKNKNNTNICS